MMNKPGRNDPCPCGSGKKHKKCCLPREEAHRPQTSQPEEPYIAELRPDLDEAVNRLLARLDRGEGKRVELELDPDYEPAMLNRRVIEQMREGEPFIPDAIQRVEFYADRLRVGARSAAPRAAGV